MPVNFFFALKGGPQSVPKIQVYTILYIVYNVSLLNVYKHIRAMYCFQIRNIYLLINEYWDDKEEL